MVGSEFRPPVAQDSVQLSFEIFQEQSCTIALGKLRHCLQVRKFFPVQGWNISSESLWPLLLLPYATRASWLLALLGDPRMRIGRQMLGPV